MAGKFVGFELVLGRRANECRDQIYARFAGLRGAAIQNRGSLTSLDMQVQGDHVLGKAVRHRGEFTYQQSDVATRRMSIGRIKPGHERATASYFLLAKRSLRGLYFQYEGVCPFADFRLWVEREARAAITQVQLAQDGKRHRGDDSYDCTCGCLIRRENLDDIVRRWQKLQEFQYTLTSATPSAPTRGPLNAFTNREVRVLGLTPDTANRVNRSQLAQAVVRARGWVKATFGQDTKSKLYGVNEHGTDAVLDLDDLVDVFDTMDIGLAITDVELQRDRHYDTLVGRRLVELAAEHDHYFNLPSQ